MRCLIIELCLQVPTTPPEDDRMASPTMDIFTKHHAHEHHGQLLLAARVAIPSLSMQHPYFILWQSVRDKAPVTPPSLPTGAFAENILRMVSNTPARKRNRDQEGAVSILVCLHLATKISLVVTLYLQCSLVSHHLLMSCLLDVTMCRCSQVPATPQSQTEAPDDGNAEDMVAFLPARAHLLTC